MKINIMIAFISKVVLEISSVNSSKNKMVVLIKSTIYPPPFLRISEGKRTPPEKRG